MANKELILDPTTLDLSRVLCDIDEIRRYNPQRYEMEQLTAIVYEDAPSMTCAGYKDITHDEFWVRGHMPNMPLMPGVIMCEAAAQLASFFSLKYDLLGAAVVGFGGMEEVRFREPVIPGDRLLIVVRGVRVRRGRMIVCDFQGFVRDTMVVEGVIKGVPLPANPGATEARQDAASA
ncbi:MAG: beta-hydroxyacyl-ACP dehydratase [Planctomycetota bacterium]|nr:MAG: beta-hydroxyacyl-ACP dehydratase [Planctomycetota bacterium]